MTLPAVSSALSGIQNATDRMNRSAEKIAKGDLDQMAKSAIDMKMAKHAVAANAAVIRAVDQMTEETIDILA